ncbi:Nuclear export mediator factor NEMF-like protein [Frankliniella fusca]|uniref:Nuclear export mediator factor NEMF-like protein n=1 Tax=Frankliniella fusca TaxID=407009 RepID=A0AAE1H6H7_9NEOP|nr:Nuclear export mediator factor NEMF-like protein [Frankliniella fusca]
MKTRFSTYDIICNVTELQRLVGMRVAQVYDVDNTTYLIKLQRPEEKAVLLLESGIRFHSTGFEWPKNPSPSGFSMKLRKHLKNKRLEVLRQMGLDRIVDFQFGTGEAAYHVILELYDRGNIILTDYEMTILNILRPHTEGEEIRFCVKEKYPSGRARERGPPPSAEELKRILTSAKGGEGLKKVLNPHLEYGPAVIEHVLLLVGFPAGVKINKGINPNSDEDIGKLVEALQQAEHMIDRALQEPSRGYILQKKEVRDPSSEDFLLSNQEFHPAIFLQMRGLPIKEFPTFDQAIDEFFSSQESQKIDLKALQQEREALKKLNNVKKDHENRLQALTQTQEVDRVKAELIMRNQELVDNAITAVRTAIASQASWTDIESMLKEAQAQKDPIATCIKQLKLEINHVTILLSDPFAEEDSDSDEPPLKPMLIDINLDLGAFANARSYYDQKRSAAKKHQKTIESQVKAFKSAEKKTKQTLKEVQTLTNISKARKTFWFEKFFWFISSENYLVIGGRDQVQNELIVKRYMRPGDIYVHADLSGASSVVIKNPSGQPIPPKTLNEAGVMAVSYSVAWEAKVVTNAWWVQSDQVSKTAPTGEYLTTGSFMIRGRKNFLPPSHLIMGFSFLFKLEESSIPRHVGERRVRASDEDADFKPDVVTDEVDQEVVLENSDEENKNDNENPESTGIEEKSSNSVSEEEEESLFPDTKIAVDHLVKNVDEIRVSISETDSVFIVGNSRPLPKKEKEPHQKKPEEKVSRGRKEDDDETSKTQQTQMKRGQKGKMKKMKEKYKDQDDEDRALRMQVLQSAGGPKETSSKKNKKGKGSNPPNPRPQVPQQKGPKKTPRVLDGAKPDGEKEEGDDDDETTEPVVSAEVDMLESLTGIPLPEDEILFAVPVVAPYNALQNYKYKVKLTPGTGKRGKGARTALNMFLKDRQATGHEKDLLKAVKDQDLARNIPGSVKVSAPQLQKSRK